MRRGPFWFLAGCLYGVSRGRLSRDQTGSIVIGQDLPNTFSTLFGSMCGTLQYGKSDVICLTSRSSPSILPAFDLPQNLKLKTDKTSSWVGKFYSIPYQNTVDSRLSTFLCINVWRSRLNVLKIEPIENGVGKTDLTAPDEKSPLKSWAGSGDYSNKLDVL